MAAAFVVALRADVSARGPRGSACARWLVGGSGRGDSHGGRRRAASLTSLSRAVRRAQTVPRLDVVQCRCAVLCLRAGDRETLGRMAQRRSSLQSGQLFPCLVVSLCAAAALWPGRARPRIVWLYGGLRDLRFVLSLGPEPAAWSHRLPAVGPFLWLARIVPGVDGLRVPRASASSCFSRSAFWPHSACRVCSRSCRRDAGLLRCWRWAPRSLPRAGLHQSRWPPLTPTAARRTEAHIAGSPSSRRGRRSSCRFLEWSIAPTLTYQYATLTHGHPIVNGYSGYGSPLQEFLGGAASPLKRSRAHRRGARAPARRRRPLHRRAPRATTPIRLSARHGRGDPFCDRGPAVEGFHSDAVDVFRLRDADTAAGESRPEDWWHSLRARRLPRGCVRCG
jgi:hypothetical protein